MSESILEKSIYVLVANSGAPLLRHTRKECLNYIKTNGIKKSTIWWFDNADQWVHSNLFNNDNKEPRFIYKDNTGQRYNVSKPTYEQLMAGRKKSKGKMRVVKNYSARN